MDRPELKQKDLDEVDRLIALANAAETKKGVPYSSITNIVRVAAIEQAANIMGLLIDDQKGDKDAKETDEDTKEEDPARGPGAG
jgi:hypothetical protein